MQKDRQKEKIGIGKVKYDVILYAGIPQISTSAWLEILSLTRLLQIRSTKIIYISICQKLEPEVLKVSSYNSIKIIKYLWINPSKDI